MLFKGKGSRRASSQLEASKRTVSCGPFSISLTSHACLLFIEKRPDWLAGAAVQMGPPALPVFPANREFYREFCKIAPSGVLVNNGVFSIRIPYAKEFHRQTFARFPLGTLRRRLQSHFAGAIF
jgi:hypothetical protein